MQLILIRVEEKCMGKNTNLDYPNIIIADPSGRAV